MICKFCGEEDAHHWHGCAEVSEKSFCVCAGCTEVTEVTTAEVLQTLDPDRFAKAACVAYWGETDVEWEQNGNTNKEYWRTAANAVRALVLKELENDHE